jgi:hypothetical protein
LPRYLSGVSLSGKTRWRHYWNVDNSSPQQPGGFYQHGGFSQPYQGAQQGGFSQPYGAPQPEAAPQPGSFDQPADAPAAPAYCPQCGSDAAVKTVQELFQLMAGGPAALYQQAMQQRGQNWNNPSNDPNYDPYHPEGNVGWGSQGRRGGGFDMFGDNPAEDIAGAALGAAMGFLGKGIAKKIQKAVEEKVVPAMQQRAAQSSQQWLPSQAEQDAIVARYPELRGCMRDQVAFLVGGTRTVPIREIQMPITMASADSLVAKLR